MTITSTCKNYTWGFQENIFNETNAKPAYISNSDPLYIYHRIFSCKFTTLQYFKFDYVYRGGGGDPSWHQAGTKTNKMNSIYDFTECAKYLIREGFVHKNRLGAIGVSAGGLLVGATINLYPHLFSAAILKVLPIQIGDFIAKKVTIIDDNVRLIDF